MTTVSPCSEPFTYTAWLMVLGVETALPAWITFNPVTRTYTISTTNQADVGSYTLRFRGNLVTLSSSVDFTLNVAGSSACDAILTTPIIRPSYEYEIGDSTLTIFVPGFVYSGNNCGITSLSVGTLSTGRSLPSFIKFSSDPNLFTVATSDKEHIKAHYLKITTTYSDGKQGTLRFTLFVIP